MTPQERRALQIVAKHQPVRAIEVAEMIGTSKKSIGRALWSLAVEGLVEKVGPHRKDIRWVLVAGAQTEAPLRHPLKPYEQAASVWQYADRCRGKK